MHINIPYFNVKEGIVVILRSKRIPNFSNAFKCQPLCILLLVFMTIFLSFREEFCRMM